MSEVSESTENFKGQLVVIGGMPRSGTTLLRGLVRGHCDIQVVFTEWIIVNSIPQLREISGMDDFSSAESMKRGLEILLRAERLQGWGLELSDVEDLIPHDEPSWDSIYPMLVEATRRKSGLRTIVMKAPGAEKHFAEIDALMGSRGWETRFVYCLRDPRDTYRSWRFRQRLWHAKHVVTDTLMWCSEWLESTLQALEANYLFPGRVKIIRFEDLVTEPREKCAELCKWLGLVDRSADMVELKGHATNSSFESSQLGRTEGGVVNVLSRKDGAVPDAEKNLVQAACAKRARLFGYSLAAAGSQSGRAAHISEHVSLARVSSAHYLRFVGRDLSVRLGRVFRGVLHRAATSAAAK
jgi:hypothetical protein